MLARLLYRAFQSDYEQTDKFDLTINGWGGEDLKFFETCVKFKVCRIILVYSSVFF